MVVNEDLEEVLDPDNLLRAQLQMLVLLPREVVAVSCIVNHGLDNLKSHFTHILHRDHPIVVLAALNHGNVRAGRCRSLLILTLLEQFGTVHLKQIDLLPNIVDVTVDHHERLLVLILTFDVDLDEELPALLLLRQLDGVLPGRVLLPADLNRSIDIKYGGFSRVLDCQELFYFRLFVFLDIAVEQECCVVLFVVDVRLTSPMSRSLVTDELLEVADQVVQLGHLNVVLNDVARIKEANRLDILLDSLVVLFLLEELVSVLLDNLTLDFSWEVCLLGNCLGLSVMRLFH